MYLARWTWNTVTPTVYPTWLGKLKKALQGNLKHKMIRVFDPHRSKESAQQNCHLGIPDFGLFRAGWQSHLWDSPEGQRNSARLDNPQEGNLLRRRSQQGRRPAWMNRRLWLEVRKVRRVPELWKKGDKEDVVRFCRQKFTRGKAQLELHMAAAIKTKPKQKGPVNTLTKEEGLKTISILYWMLGESWWWSMRKRLQYWMPYLPQPSIVRPVALRAPGPLSWQTEGAEWSYRSDPLHLCT